MTDSMPPYRRVPMFDESFAYPHHLLGRTAHARHRVAVIGAGVAGLVCAYELHSNILAGAGKPGQAPTGARLGPARRPALGAHAPGAGR
ncbi:hypothetical protein [Kitasatospora sp. NPDC050463]|uniref:hypothetical protein n=1 Tax=Kitasatospora sp. NPDC050463 TaxID=3155786 RepID=UPI003401A22D